MSAQSKKRLKKRSLRKVTPVLFVLISVFSLSIFGIFKLVSKSVASAFSADSKDLSVQNVYTVLFIPSVSGSDDPDELGALKLLVLNSSKDTALSVEIPKDEKIDALGKFGLETISNIFALGKRYSDGDLKGGIEYLVRSVEFDLGLKIDRYVYVRGDSVRTMSGLLMGGPTIAAFSPEFLFGIRDDLVTNFSSSEFLDLLKILRSSDIQTAAFGDFDLEIKKFVFNSEISMENKAVAVLNGTGMPGIAGFGGRVCENAGMRVIEVGNASRIYEESVLIIDDPDSLSASYLMRFFGFSKVMKKEDLSGFAEPAVDRADITMIVGLDIAKHL
ncbi:MAG: LCP family protein [Patescibacteria group bacterium]|jgi:hypothetical protein